MFEGTVLKQTVGVANQHKIEPEALLAVVEVESAGKSLEIDGKTPCLLFERHIFYRQLAKDPGKRKDAVARGLANSSWQPKTQYKDQGTSQGRLSLFARAKAIDEEAAIRSCSWGVGQTMGFLAEEMKFKNAKQMLAYMTDGGVPAQVECMVREIENKKLTPKLNGHDWAGFARVYNGPGYAQNRYDTKMAAAWRSWKNKGVPKDVLPAGINVPPPSGPVPKDEKTKVAVAVAAVGTVAGGATANSYSVSPSVIAFGIFLAVIAAATAIVIWKRKRDEKPQTGVLTNVVVDPDAPSDPTQVISP